MGNKNNLRRRRDTLSLVIRLWDKRRIHHNVHGQDASKRKTSLTLLSFSSQPVGRSITKHTHARASCFNLYILNFLIIPGVRRFGKDWPTCRIRWLQNHNNYGVFCFSKFELHNIITTTMCGYKYNIPYNSLGGCKIRYRKKSYIICVQENRLILHNISK